MLCRKQIVPNKKEPRLITYCMLPSGHSGDCSIHQHPNICHICKPAKDFATIRELEDHVRQLHRVWKG